MLTTIEATVDPNGNVTLLEPVTVTKTTRAIVTLLENPTAAAKPELSDDEKRRREENFARHFGAINGGNPNSGERESLENLLAQSRVDAGITDLAAQHDYYLYGKDKK